MGVVKPVGNHVAVEARDDKVALVYHVDARTLALMKTHGIPFTLLLSSEDHLRKMVHDLMEAGAKVWPNVAKEWEETKRGGS